jgi:hypothetical protein
MNVMLFLVTPVPDTVTLSFVLALLLLLVLLLILPSIRFLLDECILYTLSAETHFPVEFRVIYNIKFSCLFPSWICNRGHVVGLLVYSRMYSHVTTHVVLIANSI